MSSNGLPWCRLLCECHREYWGGGGDTCFYSVLPVKGLAAVLPRMRLQVSHAHTPHTSPWAPLGPPNPASDSTGMARSGRPWCQGDWTPVAELCKDYAWLLLSPSPVLLAFQEGREGGTSVLGQEAEGLQARGLRQRGSRRKAAGGGSEWLH